MQDAVSIVTLGFAEISYFLVVSVNQDEQFALA
jgi:hypothetical protein